MNTYASAYGYWLRLARRHLQSGGRWEDNGNARTRYYISRNGVLVQETTTILDPERSNQEAVHHFRRAMKEWRALMRLMEPFIPDAPRWRNDARAHARSLGHARDGDSGGQ